MWEASVPPGTEFLQSWDWGDFQKITKKKPRRWLLEDEGGGQGMIQGFEHRLMGPWKYLYIPRGVWPEEQFERLIEHLEEEQYVFVRIEPVYPLPKIVTYPTRDTRSRQPAQTLRIDLTHAEEELLGAMHAKTRYNINLAAKKGVTVTHEKNSALFWRLNQETTARDLFRSHDETYYAAMLACPLTEQVNAYLGDTCIAANILVNWDNTITYLHGASSNASRNLMAPYLLQWTAIKQAQAQGKKYYDFWGISPPLEETAGKPTTFFHGYRWDATDAWSGITRFKVGFGGSIRVYPVAQDIILRPLLYKTYHSLHVQRRKK